jgi:hypothetical protein
VSTNSGSVLYHGMNTKTDGMWSPILNTDNQGDEIRGDRAALAASLHWMRDNPWQCMLLMARKQSFMWGTSSTNIGVGDNSLVPANLQGPLNGSIKFLINAAWTALMVLCFRSTLTTSVWEEPKLSLACLLVFYVFVSHCFFEVQSRYQIPVVPILAVIAAAGMAASAITKTPAQMKRSDSPS